MKLHEVKVLDDKRVMLKNGFYMELDWPRADPGYITWQVKRLMDDDVSVAEASIVADGQPNDYTFYLEHAQPPEQLRRQFRAPSKKMMFDAFYKWVETGMTKLMKEDLSSDLAKARRSRSNAAKPVVLVRINRDGKESRMHDAKSYFNTEQEAKDRHDQMVANNPGKYIGHALYTGDDELALRTELHSGKFGKVTHARRPT